MSIPSGLQAWFAKIDDDGPYMEWADWFAWRPVIANGRIVWLETIERRYEGFDVCGSAFSYRLPRCLPRMPLAELCARPRDADGGFGHLTLQFGSAISGGSRYLCDHCGLCTWDAHRSVYGPCLRQGGLDVRTATEDELVAALALAR
jgi:hypothetical protein